VPFDVLWPRRDQPANDLGKQAVLIAVDAYRLAGKLTPAEQNRLEVALSELLAQGDSPGVHSAAEWLLRRLVGADRTEALIGRLAGQQRPGWRVSSTGHTLALIRGPVEFQIGSPPDEARRDDVGEDGVMRKIAHSYEIGTHEVTVSQFLKLFPERPWAKDMAPTLDCPMGGISWYEAARFCRRLSEVEGIPEQEMVFPPVNEISPDRPLVLPSNWLKRTGYRLPTEAEWEFACRAGTTTSRFFGSLDDTVAQYAWALVNTAERTRPVAYMRPNPFGLFDVLGNVAEWCFDPRQPYTEIDPAEDESEWTVLRDTQRIYRGGHYRKMTKELRSAKRDSHSPGTAFSYLGLRLARTVPSPTPQPSQ
jgi:formylglycine-generating enzyme required for sulfatase activity